MAPTNKSHLLKLDLANDNCGSINIREITIEQLNHAFTKGYITIEALTRTYIHRINLFNPTLHVVIEINLDAIDIAKELDLELRHGRNRGILHGIPILLKDNIGTHDKTETTCGSFAMVGLKPKKDAEVVKRLREAGAVILGKANLSEFTEFRSEKIPLGWSTRGGQCSNAYVIGESPSGSSAGSAVATAANLCAGALGTETDNSVVSPSWLASCVGIKPTVGMVSTEGVIPLSPTQDSVGSIGRTVTDAALIYNVITNHKLDLSFLKSKDAAKGLRVGVPRKPFWEDPSVAESLPALELALAGLKKHGVFVLDPIPDTELVLDNVTVADEDIVLFHEFKHYLNDYLETKVKHVGHNARKIHTLADIIQFNKTHPGRRHYPQEELIQSNATKDINDPIYIQAKTRNVTAARNAIDEVLLNKYKLDAVVIPTGPIPLLSAVAGYPLVTIPAGFNAKGLPFGIMFSGTAGSEEILLRLGIILEKVLNARKPSSFLPKA